MKYVVRCYSLGLESKPNYFNTRAEAVEFARSMRRIPGVRAIVDTAK